MKRASLISISVIACLVFSGNLFAEAKQSNTDKKDNIGHKRHHHRHNSPHKTVTDQMRFFTSRSGAELDLPGEEDAFFFVVFGDRTGGPAEGVSVLADAVRDTNLLEPDFVMTVGDLINGYNEAPQWKKQMVEYKEIMDHLLCPWFPVAGNHDTYWRGEGQKPENEHDSLFEKHFGPLWYAFKHKNSWFISLYTDEGNPETGEKNFRKPDCQKISPEQFTWLEGILKKAKDADHVFLFLHHPRWLKGNYGDDWDQVHDLLVKAGNVTAVFAGHIHRLHYENRDDIEYVTLATVGGGQSHAVPEAGFLHHYHVVTVRPEQVAMACIPVGDVMDPREITGAMQQECLNLTRQKPEIESKIVMELNGEASGKFEATLTNTSNRPIEVTLLPESRDSRWICIPDHTHMILPAEKKQTFSFKASRTSDKVDSTFRPLELVSQVEYLTDGFRYSLPEGRHTVPMDISKAAPAKPEKEHVLDFKGNNGAVYIDSSELTLPDGPLTLECWFKAKKYGKRIGLVTKTENSDYGIFVNKGTPHFSVFLGEKYESAKGAKKSLKTGEWHHVAGVYDGKEIRLYVDGNLVGNKEATGIRRTNDLPLIIGGDVNRNGNATSHFNGYIDEVRLSKAARYSGDSFKPERRFESDSNTVLLLHADGHIGPWLFDDSPDTIVPLIKDGASVTALKK